MINTIIFDCFGVLTTDLWKAFVDSLPPDADRELLRELNRQLDTGYIERPEFVSKVYELTGKFPQEVEKLLNNEITKNDALIEEIKKLKTQGYKIGMISNVSSNWIRESLLTRDEQELFDDMVFSFEVQLAKPDSRIFELACSRLDIEPADAIFIDDIERYCAVAESLGMKSIVYTDLSSFRGSILEMTRSV